MLNKTLNFKCKFKFEFQFTFKFNLQFKFKFKFEIKSKCSFEFNFKFGSLIGGVENGGIKLQPLSLYITKIHHADHSTKFAGQRAGGDSPCRRCKLCRRLCIFDDFLILV